MKYIRTKDRILTCLDTNTLKVGDLVGINEPILAKSNTIEELCDEFVIVIKNNSLIPNGYYVVKEYLLAYQSFKMDKDNELYGAIWTDKGLIYVAKMNDEGELCLL